MVTRGYIWLQLTYIDEVTGHKSKKAIKNELELGGKKLTDTTEIVKGFNKFLAENRSHAAQKC